MKPIDFPQVNVRLGPPSGMTTDECGALPVYSDGNLCISLWSLSWLERVNVLLFGRVWLYVIAGRSQPPVSLEVGNNILDKQPAGWGFLRNLQERLARFGKSVLPKGENTQ